MNYNNMYPNRMNDNIDPNYIYPQPYIDPLMYMNPYIMNNNTGGNFNTNTIPDYTTYSNQYVNNPQLNPQNDIPNNNMNTEFQKDNNIDNINSQMNNIPMIPMTPPNMMYPNMFNNNMMYPSMMFPGTMPPNMMYPGMMFPGTIPPNMIYPGMISNIPAINMDEFDEEEM